MSTTVLKAEVLDCLAFRTIGFEVNPEGMGLAHRMTSMIFYHPEL
jgi:hypothetical protein